MATADTLINTYSTLFQKLISCWVAYKKHGSFHFEVIMQTDTYPFTHTHTLCEIKLVTAVSLYPLSFFSVCLQFTAVSMCLANSFINRWLIALSISHENLMESHYQLLNLIYKLLIEQGELLIKLEHLLFEKRSFQQNIEIFKTLICWALACLLVGSTAIQLLDHIWYILPI